MKKLIIFIGLLFATIPTTFAEVRRVSMDFRSKKITDKDKGVNRAPMRIPVEVVYDTDTYEVKVIGDETIEAEVFLYDSVGNLEDYSATLNTYFYLYTSDTYTVHIEGV